MTYEEQLQTPQWQYVRSRVLEAIVGGVLSVDQNATFKYTTKNTLPVKWHGNTMFHI
jgi:hypothetical protein